MSFPDRRLERGLAQLEGLIAEAATWEEDRLRNEASTRFHIIDHLLLNVLAWPREQVEPEEYSAPGFADYVLGRPNRQLVVEAKREGITFDLPSETPRMSALRTLFALDPALKAAVEQAQGYAASFGLPYAAVCNGHQLVAFLATRIDGIPPFKGNALAFPSLAAMRDGFSALWDGLSQPGVESRRLSAILAGESAAAPPAKKSTMIPGYPGLARVTSLITELRMLGELFLVDMPEQPELAEEFLRECYLPSGALSQHAAVGRDILRSRYSEPLAEELGVVIKQARTKRGVSKALLADVTKASLSSRPIILLGYVGVGKTMFVRHLVRVDAKDVLRNAIVLYVDLGGEPALEHLTTFVTEHFLNQLIQTYGIDVYDRDFAARVYKDDLAAFERGPYGAIAQSHPEQYKLKQVEHLAELMADRESHLRRCLEFIANVRRRQVVTILDNVDQRPAPVQDEVFLLAATLARSWPGTVFVSLRPDTFNRSKRSGTLSAYQPRVFAVSPPRIDRVLDRRIRFAQRQLDRARHLPPLQGIGDTAPLKHYLEVIRLSLRRSRALAELVDNLSGQNARRAVELLTTLLGSPHARPDLAMGKRAARFSIPFHRFLKALMLGDGERYDPAASLVTNLLDISSDDGREHFLLPIIICFLRRSAEPGVRQGYVPAARVYGYCQRFAFRPEQITWQLERGITGSLIEVSPLDGAPELYRATAVGSYTEQRLLSALTYIDEVSIDTPIVDEITRAVIDDADVTSSRVQRTYSFSQYLDQQWQALAGQEPGFDWTPHGAAVRATGAEIDARLGHVSVRRRREH